MLDRTSPNPREHIGANNPPGAIDFAQESATALSDWMKGRPVIESGNDARAASLASTSCNGLSLKLASRRADADLPRRGANRDVVGRHRAAGGFHNED